VDRRGCLLKEFLISILSGNWENYSEWVVFWLCATTSYVCISILIEVLNIFVLLTPSSKDDEYGSFIIFQWERISKYTKWLSIRTPIVLILEQVLNFLRFVREKLQRYVKKQHLRKIINTYNKKNDAN